MEPNKETMKVIARELFPGQEGLDGSICPVIETLAERTADRFMDMAIDLDMNGTMELVAHLQDAQCRADPKLAVTLMKCIFIASGMREAAKDLELLDNCCIKDGSAYEVFTDAFMETEEMDWFQLEIIMKKEYGMRKDMSGAGGGHEKM